MFFKKLGGDGNVYSYFFFEISMFEGRSVLSFTQWGKGGERVNSCYRICVPPPPALI